MNLRKALFTLTSAEITLLVCGAFLVPGNPHSTSNSLNSFDLFWGGLGLLILFLWICGWVSIFYEYKHCFKLYLYGWIAGLIYSFFTPPVTVVPSSDLLDTLTSMLGGGILTLLALRHFGIGDWSKHSLSDQQTEADADNQPTTGADS
ncbi:MAG: hypothetical protein QM627_09390 [Luteolibacter sp.]